MKKTDIHKDQRWLPTSVKEMKELGWEQPDIILFTGDAYIDHPSFGAAVIARVIESEGLKVAVVPQPNWRDDLRDFKKLGAPRLFFGVAAGNMDSMVNHYTAARRLRSDDAYSPGGAAGFRPDYPTIVYTQALKKLFPEVPVLIGGIEASMRRLTHYDYWKNKLEPSILISSGADMLMYGMAEKPLKMLLQRLKAGTPFKSLRTLPQTAVIIQADELTQEEGIKDKQLNSYETAVASKKAYAENFVLFEKTSNSLTPVRLIEPYDDRVVVVNPPLPPLSAEETDSVYSLPFNYAPHPRYDKKENIPAWEMIKFSVNIHRGCFGGCSFCAIAAHQGKFVVSRSEKSILKEVEKISHMDDFRGYLTDLGGPSANMYRMGGGDKARCEKCSRPSCIWPSVCNNLKTSHEELTALYKKVNALPYIKKAFIGSGVRYDLLFKEWNPSAGRAEEAYLKELIVSHTSGRLKVAPEHTEDDVVRLMRKTPFSLFLKLKNRFDAIIKSEGLKYEIVPYFISSHPGCDNHRMEKLSGKLRDIGLRPEQVQDFTPTPMTLSTAMFYLGFDPYTGNKVFVAHGVEEKKKQKDYFFWSKTKNISTDKGKNPRAERKTFASHNKRRRGNS
ncbi:MAG TPA: YgiQ family radical SAM protein [Bacteroidales bacterium]|nr:YgiQ family radical SAM protein [Bacteroidales bacterium]